MLDAIILCGGQGTRLASVVKDVPKPLAPVRGRPFLDYLIEHLARSGAVCSITLATHHLSDAIATYYANRPTPLPLRVVREDKPLGTAGGLMFAWKSLNARRAMCLNGDSMVGGDLQALAASHEISRAAITLGLVEVSNSGRFGSVVRSPDGRITSFKEKSAPAGPGLINAGIYVVERDALDIWSGKAASMEIDVLPDLTARDQVRGEVLAGPFIDIGLPDTYADAAEFLMRFETSGTAKRET